MLVRFLTADEEAFSRRGTLKMMIVDQQVYYIFAEACRIVVFRSVSRSDLASIDHPCLTAIYERDAASNKGQESCPRNPFVLTYMSSIILRVHAVIDPSVRLPCAGPEGPDGPAA